MSLGDETHLSEPTLVGHICDGARPCSPDVSLPLQIGALRSTVALAVVGCMGAVNNAAIPQHGPNQERFQIPLNRRDIMPFPAGHSINAVPATPCLNPVIGAAKE